MIASFFRGLGRTLSGLWWVLDATRRALLNLLLLALLVLLAWAWLNRPQATALQPQTVLVLELQGPLVEQRSGSSRDNLSAQLQGRGTAQTVLRDVTTALDRAARDPQISHALLLLDGLGGAGLPALREIAAALQRFKAGGKAVIAWGAGYDQRSYHLAAQASEVWLHPMGEVQLTGFGRQRPYYRDALQRLGVQAHALRAGTFKNAAEPFTEVGPTPAALLAETELLEDLWALWLADVEGARGLPAGTVMQHIDALPGSLQASGGDAAALALQQGLVDRLVTRDELRAEMRTRGAAGSGDAGTADATDAAAAGSFRQVSLGAYLARQRPATDGDAVALVVAAGTISDGRAGPGRIGGLSTSDLIRQAREDRRVKALVLRVDSPGGSPYGSELIRRELELTRAAGKPVVVSMGALAASGGYWISLAADEVIADAATITGSIGVVGLLINAHDGAQRVGVNTGGHSTTWLGRAQDPLGELDPRVLALGQAGVDHVYRDFLQRVAQARGISTEAVDAVAQGRVWSGRQALAHGLVDRLGGYGDALTAATRRADLPADARVQLMAPRPSRVERLLQTLDTRAASLGLWPAGLLTAWAGDSNDNAAWLTAAAQAAGLPPALTAHLRPDLEWLLQAAARPAPWLTAVHCLCSAP